MVNGATFMEIVLLSFLAFGKNIYTRKSQIKTLKVR